MGLGPPATQAGDLICILYGRPSPFVLRQNPDHSTYRLFGEAYVTNIMYGEAFELRDKHALPDKTFVIDSSNELVRTYFRTNSIIKSFFLHARLRVLAVDARRSPFLILDFCVPRQGYIGWVARSWSYSRQKPDSLSQVFPILRGSSPKSMQLAYPGLSAPGAAAHLSVVIP